MTGVTRAIVLLAALATAGSACATKVPPARAGEPFAQPIVLENVPRHVDDVMRDLQEKLLKPVREVMRAAPVSPKALASDGSYGRWLTQVSEALVYRRPLPTDIDRLSRDAYEDLARISGRLTKHDVAVVDLDLLAHRLVTYFDAQSTEARKTAAAYLETAFSIPG